MSKQQQQQQQQQGQKQGMESINDDKSLPEARPSQNQHCHDRKRNVLAYSNKTTVSSSSSWRLSSSSTTGYLSLVLIVAAAMKLSFMAGQYATAGSSSSLDCIPFQVVVPQPVRSAFMLLQQQLQPLLTTTTTRESLVLHKNSQRQDQPQAATAATTGRQVVVTIDHVSQEFLSSEDSMTNAMMSLVEEELQIQQQQQQHLVLLSHHCHHSSRSSSSASDVVSCVGILPDGHVLIHAWPLQNTVRVDFFTTSSSISQNSQQLHDDESIIAAIYKTFAMTMPHQSGGARAVVAPPRIQSSVKRRGFSLPEQQQQEQQRQLNHLDASVNDTYVLIGSSVQQQQDDDDDDDYAIIYYEALVHPAMLVHPDPRRVAVIGSGTTRSSISSSATVRQVLKHNTVETVVVLGWPSKARRIFNDARVVVETEDASSWFANRYSHEEDEDDDDEEEEAEEALFDVVIIDSSTTAPIFGMMDAIHSALSEQGVLVADVGVADRLGDAGWNYRRSNDVQHRLDMIQALQDAEFQSVKTYTERRRSKNSRSSSSSKSLELRIFHIAFCDFDSKARWYMNQAEIDLELDKRMLRIPTAAVSSNDATSSSSSCSSSTRPELFNLDGATIMSYQFPTRIAEEVYCRQIPTPDLCVAGHGYDPHTPNVPLSALEVKPSGIHGAGRGVFFKEDFAKGAYISIDSGVHGMSFMPFTFSLIEKMEKSTWSDNTTSVGITGAGDLWEPLESYMDGYGFENLFYGKASAAVDPGIITFVNHGCNGTNNIGSVLNVTEMTADIKVIPMDVGDSDSFDDEFYSPFADRNHWIYTFTQDKLQVDVKAGMEVLDNYLFFYANWTEAVASLRSECQGLVTGTVVDYERWEQQDKREHV